MKKFLTSFAIATIFSIAAQAQDAATSTTATVGSGSATTQQMSNGMKQQRMMKKAMRQDQAASSQTAGATTSATGDKVLKVDKENKWKEKYNQASPEEKARMDRRRAMMEKLTPEQKTAVKNEIERHRQEMKRLTGMDEEVSLSN